MRCIWRVLQDRDSVKQALQEALLQVWKQRQRIERHPNPGALILRICTEKAIDELRKSVCRVKHEEPIFLDHERQLVDERSPAEMVLRKELHEEVRNAIGELPRKQAIAVMMRIVEGCSYSDISQCLECSEATVRAHVRQGRLRLAALLKHLAPVTVEEEAS